MRKPVFKVTFQVFTHTLGECQGHLAALVDVFELPAVASDFSIKLQ